MSLALIAALFARRAAAGRAGPGLGRMIATLVEGKELLETVVASVVAGVGVTFVFSVAIWGVARFADLSRERAAARGRRRGAGRQPWPWPSPLAAVVVGIIVMTSK